ncbi:MAG: phosphate propanoyltransferase [Defluviitaleaceae bacterium]|nr:phosphate propanoyltransferase [Defluviitaleaceae bacterium]
MADIERLVRSIVAAIGQNEGFNVKIGVSARHIHLCRGDMDVLFGANSELTRRVELMGGQFAAEQTVTIVSQKMRTIENVRVLGPLRGASQLEISATDAVKLGIAAPARDSGDLADAAPISVIGPAGAIHLPRGCIIARRHIHMSPEDAITAGAADGDMVSVRTNGDRGLIFDNVKIRIDKSFTTEMHIDTDEANAAGIKTGDIGQIIRGVRP